jgi:anti-sigma regulatory factor (Ser/Thr protein kinase)
MKPLLNIVLPASQEHMEPLRDAATAIARESGFSAELIARVELAVEEALTNVILHAYADGTGNVSLSCIYDDGGQLAFTLTDSGVAFDPTAAASAGKGLSTGKRAVGGVGIDLLRHNADRLSYRRTNGKNILELMFNPESGQP